MFEQKRSLLDDILFVRTKNLFVRTELHYYKQRERERERERERNVLKYFNVQFNILNS